MGTILAPSTEGWPNANSLEAKGELRIQQCLKASWITYVQAHENEDCGENYDKQAAPKTTCPENSEERAHSPKGDPECQNQKGRGKLDFREHQLSEEKRKRNHDYSKTCEPICGENANFQNRSAF